ncbi:MAG: hypothetical protein HQL51_01695 [Magnetococcales bacterium]|nr:hypothetical protein [Magnetococcales bacterium]
MSVTTVFALTFGDRVEYLTYWQNSWLWAPPVWNSLIKHYINPVGGFWGDEDLSKLWKLTTNQSVPKFARAVLSMTFYGAYIRAADFKVAQDDIAKYHQMFPKAKHFEALQLLMDTTDAPALCFWANSVEDNPWNGPIDWTKTFDVYKSGL